jgi:hypothetical protein
MLHDTKNNSSICKGLGEDLVDLLKITASEHFAFLKYMRSPSIGYPHLIVIDWQLVHYLSNSYVAPFA